MHYSCQEVNMLCKTLKRIDRKLKRKKKKPIDTGKQSYDEYGDKKNQKIDYERDKPPHW